MVTFNRLCTKENSKQESGLNFISLNEVICPKKDTSWKLTIKYSAINGESSLNLTMNKTGTVRELKERPKEFFPNQS